MERLKKLSNHSHQSDKVHFNWSGEQLYVFIVCIERNGNNYAVSYTFTIKAVIMCASLRISTQIGTHVIVMMQGQLAFTDECSEICNNKQETH